jgi:pimeloyl-ACP methyl ester carboxylesterase
MTRSKTFRFLSATVVAIALLVAATATGASEQQLKKSRGITNIVLVHGAWADGSSWSKVIPLLEARGLQVVAVQLPLTSLADDDATVQRAIALVDGPLLLVAHSYGGVVITEAGNDPKVAGLVYVAAFAPQEGQSAFDLAIADPTPVLQELRQDQYEFLKITPNRNSGGLRSSPVRLRADRAYRHAESNCRRRLVECPGFHRSLAEQAVSVCDCRPRSRRRTEAPGDVRSADERHVNHPFVQPRGDVVSTVRCGLPYPQSGTRRPVTDQSSLASASTARRWTPIGDPGRLDGKE